MRIVNWVGCIFAVGLGGCSLYPIPDDVMAFHTEDIVRHARCEMRSALLEHMIDDKVIRPPFTGKGIKSQIDQANGKKAAIEAEAAKAGKPVKLVKVMPSLTDKEEKLLRLANVAVVYTYDFNIKENNKAGGSAAFRLPWPMTNVLDVGAEAGLDVTRQGQRVFGAQDRWDDLLVRDDRCKDVWPRQGNPAYPLSGSIGVGRVVETFIDIDEQGGAKDNFVDTLTFATDVSGGANASVKLDPVQPRQFRPVSGDVGLSASRLDIHKMVISLAFPRPDKPDPITGVVRVDGDLNAPFERPADWRARYNLCVADARAREDSFKLLRLQAPEVYCITYADEFAPQYGRQPERRIAVTVTQGPNPQAGATTESSPRNRVPVPAAPQRRPNLRQQPYF
jgi:hypothetical protein